MTSTSSSSSSRNHYTLTVLLFIFLFLCSVFLFTKRALEPSLSPYRDLSSLTGGQKVESNPGAGNLRGDVIVEQDKRDGNESISAFVERGDGFRGNLSVGEEEQNGDESVGTPIENSGDFRGKNPVQTEERLRNESSGSLFETGAKSLSDLSVEKEEDRFAQKESADAFIGAGVDVEKMKRCDLYTGTWIKDEQYPLYEPSSCPYVDDAFDCQRNGRGDSDYLKWRWKPDGCDLPRFNATDFLVRLRGKRLMLVGDSMNRNQFESMLCLLREGLLDKSRMYEIHGHKITKGRGYFVFKFEDYNCSVEFVRSHFLVKEGIRVNAQGSSNPTLSIDRIDKTHGRWKRADILVFNTGHWWVHGKTARGINYYKEWDYLYPKFDSVEAYRRALRTWAKWIHDNIDPAKQLVFYRGYSSAHFRGGDWDSGGSCNGEKEPILRGAFLDSYPQKMKIVEEVIRETKVPVTLLNVTKLTNFRKDAHPSVYGKTNTEGRKVSTRRQDCSHWCLPGVPDAWNELIYANLVLRQSVSRT